MSHGSDFEGWVKKELGDLRRIRDELRVKANLGKAEVRDRLETLERGIASLESKAKRATRAAEQPLKQLERDLRNLANDLRDGFRKIRDAI